LYAGIDRDRVNGHRAVTGTAPYSLAKIAIAVAGGLALVAAVVALAAAFGGG